MSELLDKPDTEHPSPQANAHDALAEVTALLRRNRLIEGLVHEQREEAGAAPDLAESAVYRANKAELQRRLDRLHPADIADILEALPLDERLYIWDLVKADRDGDILPDVKDAVRMSLIASRDNG